LFIGFLVNKADLAVLVENDSYSFETLNFRNMLWIALLSKAIDSSI
jgi:hypothetical protein